MNEMTLPKKIYERSGCTAEALREVSEVYHCKRALLVADPEENRPGAAEVVKESLERQGIRTAQVFAHGGIPTESDIRSAVTGALEFGPDCVIGVGGGRTLNTAKLVWLLYESPTLNLEAAAKAQETIPAGKKAKLVLIAASFGSGGQNAPFAIWQGKNGEACVLSSTMLLPEISVTDAAFTERLSPVQIRRSAMATLSLAIHAYGDARSCEETRATLREAINLILNHLYEAEEGDSAARETLHHAAAMAGAAFGNIWTNLNEEPDAHKTEAEKKEALRARMRTLAAELGYQDENDFWLVCGNLR